MDSSQYREAGVDLERKGDLVRRLESLARSTGRPGVLEGVGGFAGLLALREAAPGARDPVLVAGADGVGTKLKLTASLGRHRVAGIDCVAMCVNDVLAAGGEPLFLLDYLAMARLDEAVAAAIVEGIAEGCREAGCVLLGGETAEMPGFYAEGEYEVAGFCVGVAERSRLGTAGSPSGQARPGDVLVGLASSGLHSNGFSLVRRVLAASGADLAAPVPWEQAPARSLGEALTEPTRIYVKPVRALAAAVDVHALAHITGGGMPDNLARVLPPGTRAVVHRGRWPEPPVFGWVQGTGGIGTEEMFRVFNMGIGMVAAVRAADAEAAVTILQAAGQAAWIIGTVEEVGAVEARPAAMPSPFGSAAPERGVPARRLRFGPSAKRPSPGGWVEIVEG